MKRYRLFSFLITSAILMLASADGAQAQFRPNRNMIRQERQQQRIQQQQLKMQQRAQQGGNPQQKKPIPPELRNKYPAANQRVPGGGLPGTEPLGLNKPLSPQQREIRRQLVEALALTPEQKLRINDIHRSHEDEAIAVGRRLRQARQKLDRALWNENYNEAEVKQYSEELAQAQADQIRLQYRINAEIRGAINPEQIRRFREKERELQMQRHEQLQRELQRQNNPDNPPPAGPPPDKRPPNGNTEDALLIWATRP